MTPAGLPVLKNLEALIEPELLNSFPFGFLQKNQFLPVRGQDGGVLIIAADPLQIDLGEIQRIIGKEVSLASAPAEIILEAIEKFYYHPTSSRKIIEDLQDKEMEVLQEEINGESGDLLDLANKAPVIRLVNQILYRATTMRATDIHLQTTETSFRVRYRIDGLLYDMFVLPKKYQPAVISRIKIMSDLDIAEKRLPQDGRTTFKADSQQIDVRVSIIPTFFGESAVLRLLNKAAFLFDLEKLGLRGDTYDTFSRLIHYDHGIVLLT
ncbi:MAG TPA: ATPase, T2SS/T4P/T4SS family, partial [bacterium]|nr:ATPase, T2SS/T4P/T4SS family [bacterium]